MIKILHAADFHLDSVFKSLPPDKAALRRRAQREIIERIALLAEEKRAQLVFLSGDLFDDGENTLYDTKELLAGELGSVKARIFISPGNHDYFSAGSPYSSCGWPENVHIFRSASIERFEIPELGCDVYGAGFTESQCLGSLIGGFHVSEPSRMNFMALHGDTAPDSVYNPVTEHDIAETGLDYLALGHRHDYSGLKTAGNVRYAYPGCPEGRGFDETGDKGVIFLEAEKGKISCEFVPVAKRRYFDVAADVSGFDSVGGIGRMLPQGTENDICRITFKGEADGFNLKEAEAALESRFFHLTVRDVTVPRRNVWDRADDDTLTGLFLKKMKAEYDSSDEERRRDIELAALYGLAALENREEPKI